MEETHVDAIVANNSLHYQKLHEVCWGDAVEKGL